MQKNSIPLGYLCLKIVLALEELQVYSSHLWHFSFVPEYFLLGTLNASNVLSNMVLLAGCGGS